VDLDVVSCLCKWRLETWWISDCVPGVVSPHCMREGCFAWDGVPVDIPGAVDGVDVRDADDVDGPGSKGVESPGMNGHDVHGLYGADAHRSDWADAGNIDQVDACEVGIDGRNAKVEISVSLFPLLHRSRSIQ